MLIAKAELIRLAAVKADKETVAIVGVKSIVVELVAPVIVDEENVLRETSVRLTQLYLGSERTSDELNTIT